MASAICMCFLFEVGYVKLKLSPVINLSSLKINMQNNVTSCHHTRKPFSSPCNLHGQVKLRDISSINIIMFLKVNIKSVTEN